MDIHPLSDKEFELFRGMIYQVAGISLSDIKKPLVSGRLAKRVRHFGKQRFGDYFKIMMADKAEFQNAIDLLTTNETYFFREPKHFDFLRDTIIPALRQKPKVRIWCGASSTGEEPYTIAMMLAEHLGSSVWELLASDISTRVLDTARKALYPLEDAEGIPKPYLVNHCLKGVGDLEGQFSIQPTIRQKVHFRQINLNDNLPSDIGEFDTVFLRNVMIYFNMETKQQVVKRVVKQLKPGGWFIVSHSESLNGITAELEMVKPSIYRKPIR
ncbi:protein-glutamate O-methyltransferase CheR [Leeia sp. TBRC 13508]|uniref:Chemotaxis protein methyltransferase n=1 Tax=Leeia speluncae TaxID=2884804 RepID=A0ABS8D6Z5_9NEIS|nr:protein-glutamate O-methyltransferase CheR [Leeia speluncae]MCB6183964.1 protein-glutamate O-methyltransferase CheR [Leeia speluncae]